MMTGHRILAGDGGVDVAGGAAQMDCSFESAEGCDG